MHRWKAEGGWWRAEDRRELYIAGVSGEYRIPLKMHKCSAVQ